MRNFAYRLSAAAERFDGPVTAHLVGGLTEEKAILLPLIKKYLPQNTPVSLSVCRKRPAEGALSLAARQIGKEIG